VQPILPRMQPWLTFGGDPVLQPGRARAGLASIVLTPRLVEITGGEPTLHPRLDLIVGVVNRFASGAAVRLVTNGARLARWDSLPIEQVSWSKYPGQREPHYTGGASRFKVLDRSEFRVQYGTPDDVEQTYRDCALAHHWKCLTLKAGRLYRCGPSVALGARGVNPASEREVAGLIGSRPPQCSRCLGTSGPTRPWSQARHPGT